MKRFYTLVVIREVEIIAKCPLERLKPKSDNTKDVEGQDLSYTASGM